MSGQPGPSNALQTSEDSERKGHHRRTSSLWVPPSRPVYETLVNPSQLFRSKAGPKKEQKSILNLLFPDLSCFGERPSSKEFRRIVPNNQKESVPRYAHPNKRFADNEISTTKYSILSFIPKNLFEQFHRLANLYFIFIIILNMIIGAFGRYISMLPIAVVLTVTAIKDAYEDYRRFKSDSKINHQTCRVWDSREERYRKLEWKHILVGDFVHLSHDEVIPADMLLLRSSDTNGICYVETSNLDGESNLKQRTAIRAMGKFHSNTVPLEFSPQIFDYNVIVEEPSTDVYRFEGRLESVENGPPLPRELTLVSKENMLLRGCVIKNTDFIEGIVLYAGSESKAMLNNSGPRYKRSSLEKKTNWDILWCVLILLVLCTLGGILNTVWLKKYADAYIVPFFTYGMNVEHERKFRPYWDGFVNFFSFIIVLQVLVPISLYVSIELIKLGQIWFLSQDIRMYYEPFDKRIQCRALNIPEELGQIEYVMSDKTGTLTENQMIFRRCSVVGKNFGGMAVVHEEENQARPVHSKDRLLESLLNLSKGSIDDEMSAFFLTMAICNTVVVNAKPHEDLMDEDGEMIVRSDSYRKAVKTDDVTKKSSPQPLQIDSPDSNRSVQSIELIDLQSARPSPESSQRNSLTDVIEEEEEKKKEEMENVENEEREIGKQKEKRKGILSHSRPSYLNIKLKGFSPFRRMSSKSSTSTTTPLSEIVPPPSHSYYDSESPDELALVEAAKDYGVRLLRRHFDEVTVYLKSNNTMKRFRVLHTLPFDSDRKRMSVVVREVDGDGQVVLLTKGADASILPLLNTTIAESDEGTQRLLKAQEHLTDYAKDGLRTLCLARRYIDDAEYREWRSAHEEAELDVSNKEELLIESALRIEKDLELLGVTAIEDRLQEGVPETIHSLREAGIRVWVLTGDKTETAVNIAYSSRLFSQSMDLLNIGATDVPSVSELLDLYLERIDRLRKANSSISFGIVLSGHCIDFCLDLLNLERFQRLLESSRSVLCCRATPLQKAALVRFAKEKLKGKVLAIGDGANDVSMIQGADVGVGLSGQEGMQAVMASDYALARFRFLCPLLLVHGHWCYHRLTQTILYFFYKNAMIVFVTFWAQIFNGWSSQVIIDPMYMMVYNLLFTSVPPLIYGCLEQDAEYDVLIDNPNFYEQGRGGAKYKWYSFWMNMADVIWQSAVIYFSGHLSLYGQEMNMWDLGTIQCAQLLLVNTFHLALIVQYWTWPLLLSMVLSLLVFFAFALIYNAAVISEWGVNDSPVMVAEMTMIDPRFWFLCLFSTVFALLPRLLWICLRNSLRPSQIQKVSDYQKGRRSLFALIRSSLCVRTKRQSPVSP